MNEEILLMNEEILLAYQAKIYRDEGPGYVKFKCFKPINIPKDLEVLQLQVLQQMHQGALKCFKKDYPPGTSLEEYYTNIVTTFFLRGYKPLTDESLSSQEEASLCLGDLDTFFYKPYRRRNSTNSSNSNTSCTSSNSQSQVSSSCYQWYIFVYYDKNSKEALASCFVERDGLDYEIHEVCVLNCGKGIGTRMLNKVINMLRTFCQSCVIKIFCYNKNEAALSCYSRVFAEARRFIGTKDGEQITLFVLTDKKGDLPMDDRFLDLTEQQILQPISKKQKFVCGGSSMKGIIKQCKKHGISIYYQRGLKKGQIKPIASLIRSLHSHQGSK